MICSFLNIIQSHPETSIRKLGIPLVSGAKSQFFELSEGIVLLQEWNVFEYHILHLNCQYQRPFVFEWQEKGSASIFVCCLSGMLEISDPQLGNLVLKEQQGYVFSQQGSKGFMHVKGRSGKAVFLLLIGPDSPPIYPSLQDKMPAKTFSLTASLLERIEQLLFSSYLYIRHFHKELVQTILELANHESVSVLSHFVIREEDLSGIHAIKELLDKNPEKNWSLASLSRKAGMNPRKLSDGFSSVYGKSPYTYAREARLQNAKEAIIQTRSPLKLLAKRAGYPSYSNFSIAFKAFFGINPSSLRKK